METLILKTLYDKIEKNQSVALVTLIESSGATPRKAGTIMGVTKDEIIGTVGGGLIEFKVIELARQCIEKNENKYFEFDLNGNGQNAIDMSCGGSVKGYIKTFKPNDRIVIVGAGHIGRNLMSILKDSPFEVVVFDDRDENIEGVTVGDIETLIKNLPENPDTYFVVVTKGHKSDFVALKNIFKKEFRYIGMVGSKNKVLETRKKLIEEGIEIPEERFFSPIGLDFSNGTPYEIAVEILAEILAVKNKKEVKHRKLIV
ncbi:XdhC family protein [Fusobacterium perfoetens]|uniref:XdhC family protein n=1 Tax=Fusobacterium perfoetens TaxID=852 RepID=UPI001F24DDCB|nr:XdhC family protein [Fusobacterium perfoetens]MCF2612770.1 XdhC family protein [Fusobacterium perfoetens]